MSEQKVNTAIPQTHKTSVYYDNADEMVVIIQEDPLGDEADQVCFPKEYAKAVADAILSNAGDQ